MLNMATPQAWIDSINNAPLPQAPVHNQSMIREQHESSSSRFIVNAERDLEAGVPQLQHPFPDPDSVFEPGIDIHVLTWRAFKKAQQHAGYYSILLMFAWIWLLVSCAAQAGLLALLIISLNGTVVRNVVRSDAVVCAGFVVLGYICTVIAQDLQSAFDVFMDARREHIIAGVCIATPQRLITLGVLYGSYLLLAQSTTVLEVLLNGVGILFICSVDDYMAHNVLQLADMRNMRHRTITHMSNASTPMSSLAVATSDTPFQPRTGTAEDRRVHPLPGTSSSKIQIPELPGSPGMPNAGTMSCPDSTLPEEMPGRTLPYEVCVLLFVLPTFVLLLWGPNFLLGYCIFTFPGWNQSHATKAVAALVFIFGTYICAAPQAPVLYKEKRLSPFLLRLMSLMLMKFGT